MSLIAQATCRNLLIGSLGKEDFTLLQPHLSRVDLAKDDVVATAGARIDTLCFPEAGVVSFAERMRDGCSIGIGIIGWEGLAGWPVLLGCAQSPHEAVVAIDGGTALRIANEPLLEACRVSPTLLHLLLRFVQSFTIQLGRTIVSNLTEPVERRLSRWLLMNHDRMPGDEIALTHEQIGTMLGVRRASVTDALHILEGEGMIRCKRGLIVIRERAPLKQMAGETYGFAEAEYGRLIAPFGKGG